jgi:hypothetical protein
MVTLVAVWIFVSTLKLDPAKPSLVVQIVRRRALAKLKFKAKLQKSLQTMGTIMDSVDIPQPAPSSPGI